MDFTNMDFNNPLAHVFPSLFGHNPEAEEAYRELEEDQDHEEFYQAAPAGHKCDFYYNQFNKHYSVDISKKDWEVYSKKFDKVEDMMTEVLEKSKAKKAEVGWDKLNEDNRKRLESIDIIPKDEPDLVAKEQRDMIFSRQGSTIQDCIDFFRLRQFVKRFRKAGYTEGGEQVQDSEVATHAKPEDGRRSSLFLKASKRAMDEVNTTEFTNDIKMQMTELAMWKKQIFLIQKATLKNKNEVVINVMETSILNFQPIPAKTHRLVLQENKGKVGFLQRANPEGRIWVQYNQFIYFFHILNNWDDRTQLITLKRFDLHTKEESVVRTYEPIGEEQLPVIGKEKEGNHLRFGTQQVIFSLHIPAPEIVDDQIDKEMNKEEKDVPKKPTEQLYIDPDANPFKSEEDFLNQHFVVLQSDDIDSQEEKRYTSRISHITNLSKSLCFWKSLLKNKPMSYNIIVYDIKQLEPLNKKNKLGTDDTNGILVLSRHNEGATKVNLLAYINGEGSGVKLKRAKDLTVPFQDLLKDNQAQYFDGNYQKVYTRGYTLGGEFFFEVQRMGERDNDFKFLMYKKVGLTPFERDDQKTDNLLMIFFQDINRYQIFANYTGSCFYKNSVSLPAVPNSLPCVPWSSFEASPLVKMFKSYTDGYKQIDPLFINFYIDDQQKVRYIPASLKEGEKPDSYGPTQTVKNADFRDKHQMNHKYHLSFIDEEKREGEETQKKLRIEGKGHRQFQPYHDDRTIWLRLKWEQNYQKINLSVVKQEVGGEVTELHSTIGHYDKNAKETRKFRSCLVQSSAVEAVDASKCVFKQKYSLGLMSQSQLYMEIFEYLLVWTEVNPMPNNTKFYQIGRKLLVLNKPYNDDNKLKDKTQINYYPYYPNKDDYFIEGTHLFTNNDKSECNIIIPTFNDIDYQFDGQLCSTGYKLFTTQGRDENVALLIDTRLSDGLLNVSSRSLSPSQRNLIFEQQIRVVLNMWPKRDIIQTIHNYFTPAQLDPLVSMEVVNCNSIADFLITEPNLLKQQLTKDRTTQVTMSLIARFGKESMRHHGHGESADDCVMLDYYQRFLDDLPKELNWIRKPFEIMDDLLMSNPLYKCFEYTELDKTIISCGLLIEEVFKTGKSQVSYNRLIQVLPFIVDPKNKQYGFDGYGKFFVDYGDDGNEEGLCFAVKLRHKDLPKYSDKVTFLRQFRAKDLPNTDLTHMIIDKVIDEDQSQEKSVKDIPVDHFMINLNYLGTDKRVRHFFNEGVFRGDQVVSEFEFAQIINFLNDKFGGNITEQQAMQDIINYTFFDKTDGYFKRQFIIYCMFFILPYFTQLLAIGIPWFVIIALVSIAEGTNIFFFWIETIAIRQDGWMDYISDYNNKFDVSMFCLFSVYFIIRMFDQGPTLVGFNTPQPVTPLLFVKIVLNVFITIQITLKLMFFMQMRQKFGMLVQLIKTCIVDIKEFLVFMMTWIFAFGLISKILGSDNSLGAYPNINIYFQIFIQTWEDSLGNINPPSNNYWGNHAHDKKSTGAQAAFSYIFIYLIYIFWFANQFLILIILLNFLIAVISQSYENVMNSSIIFKYSQRVNLNLECASTMEFRRQLQPKLDCYILSSNVEKATSNEWAGFCQTVKKFVKKQAVTVLNRVDKVNEELQEIKTEIKQDLKNSRDRTQKQAENLNDAFVDLQQKVQEIVANQSVGQ